MQKRLNILFLHQNFPAQFKNLAPALAQAGHSVTALAIQKNTRQKLPGVRVLHYALKRNSTHGIHPWMEDFESKIIRAEACFHACRQLRDRGFTPDSIIAHPGWGESLFVHDIWPQARIGLYAEWYYRPGKADADFDPEFPPPDRATHGCRLQIRNLPLDMQQEKAHSFLCPTQWQADSLPAHIQRRTHIIHDGIDTDALCPDPDATLHVDKKTFTRHDEIITFVNRNLEPYRGFHSFMRALPTLLQQRPKAQILIIGNDGTGYGAAPKHGSSWREVFTAEVRPAITDYDWERVHFLGRLSYSDFVSALQISSVHVYLSYPFVLSWSLLEAMSLGCAVVASDTAPVREVVQHGSNGLLVDFFSPQDIAQAVCTLLDHVEQRQMLGIQARRDVQQHFDLHSVCLPQQMKWVDSLAQDARV